MCVTSKITAKDCFAKYVSIKHCFLKLPGFWLLHLADCGGLQIPGICVRDATSRTAKLVKTIKKLSNQETRFKIPSKRFANGKAQKSLKRLQC
jgi:hypothetical protein